ncbi:hypothetical protein L218DRAFT_1008191 [Marasmius fiardii PR-910]|nr:hypothetical protein L218DRAFT_1008191 [Marasmius fiardii PR-910]
MNPTSHFYPRGGQRQEGGNGGAALVRHPDVRRLQQALVNALVSLDPADAFQLNLIGAALGALAKAKVNESYDNGISFSQRQEVALLLCEAVYLFERSCAAAVSLPQYPLAPIIQNKHKGEELAKIVIDEGLDYLVHPHSFEVRHFHSAYQYFHSHLKRALQRALPRPVEDIMLAARVMLEGI